MALLATYKTPLAKITWPLPEAPKKPTAKMLTWPSGVTRTTSVPLAFDRKSPKLPTKMLPSPSTATSPLPLNPCARVLDRNRGNRAGLDRYSAGEEQGREQA